MREFELVLPCYNEAKSLEQIIIRARDAALRSGYTPNEFQLVVVQNGSLDDSSEVLKRLALSPLGEWFRVVDVTVNQGYGFGLRSGLAQTEARFVGWSHADQQCDPADAFTALALLKQSGDRVLVKGTRTGRNWKDAAVSRVFALHARSILGLKIDEVNAQPKVFPRELLTHLPNPPKNFAFDLYVLYRASKVGYRVETIEVSFPPRVHGVSNWASTFAGRYKTILGMIRYMLTLAASEGRL